MLLVLQWLDDGRPEDGTIGLSVTTAAAELDCGTDRAGVLKLLGALSDLEERGVVAVALDGPRRDPRVTLAPELRSDAGNLFDRPSK